MAFVFYASLPNYSKGDSPDFRHGTYRRTICEEMASMTVFSIVVAKYAPSLVSKHLNREVTVTFLAHAHFTFISLINS